MYCLLLLLLFPLMLSLCSDDMQTHIMVIYYFLFVRVKEPEARLLVFWLRRCICICICICICVYLSLSIYIYIYMCIDVVCVYIYIHIERERERERERSRIWWYLLPFIVITYWFLYVLLGWRSRRRGGLCCFACLVWLNMYLCCAFVVSYVLLYYRYMSITCNVSLCTVL